MTTRLTRLVDQVSTMEHLGPDQHLALDNIQSGAGRIVEGAELPIREPDPQGMVSYRAGDVLFGKLRPYLAKSLLASGSGLASSELIVLRARPVMEPRWLAYLAQSEPFVGWAVATSDGVKMPRTSWERLRDFPVEPPGLVEQRAIADYLDAETARIDNLIAARRSMLSLVSERLDGALSAVLDRPDWAMVALKWKTRVTVGIVIRPSDLYAASGEPCLRGFNVRPGLVSDADLAYISPEGNAANAKSMLGDGDIVVVRTGNAGAAAVVPDWAVGGNCVDLLLVRRTDSIEPRFLEAVLNSAVVRRQVDEGSVGALQAHFNTESLANLRVPVPSMSDQLTALAALDALRAQASAMSTALSRQIDLLLERRKALITAAVTGQLEIPGAAA